MRRRKLRRALDQEAHRARMAASALKVMVSTTPDPLLLADEAVFSEREPPYDWSTDQDEDG